MYIGKLVFAQLIGHLPLHTFRRCVACYDGNRKVQRFACLDQYLCMALEQLTYRESLRDYESGRIGIGDASLFCSFSWREFHFGSFV